MNLIIRKFRVMVLIAVLPYAAYCTVARISLKDSSMVNDTIIRLGDIATILISDDDSKKKLENFIIGEAAPAGYSRFVSKDDLLTYKLCPAFKSLQIICSGENRTLVTTDFIEKSVTEIKSELIKFMEKEIAWPDGSWELTIDNELEHFKILDKPYTVQFTDLVNKYPRGKFNLSAKVIQGSKCIRVSVNCNLKVVLPVVVASESIERGQLITTNVCTIQSVDITHLGIVPYDSLSKVIGKKASRIIKAGQILSKQWIEEIPAVEKGDPVTIVAGRNRIKVSVEAVAREPGNIGEKIWVENSVSHKLVRVMVKSKGIVTNL